MVPSDPPQKALAVNFTSCDDIRFVGKQEQMEEILAIGDLFLLTSDYESFGLAALEAMAAGVPVISTNAGGLPEINEHGVTGYMSNVGNVEEMSKYAIELLSDAAKLAEFKKNAYAQANKFDIQNIVPKYEKLYDQFL